ncbi:MAG TPA: YqjK family protein [Burkholderiales bacterium]|nr:YqjK family protein [Burkholderiales bacterium]
MNERLRGIVLKRRALVAQAAEQRGELAAHAASVRQSLAFADLAWRGYRNLKSRPLGAALIAVALIAVGPGEILRMGYRSGLLLMGVLRVIRFIRMLR